MPTFSISSTLIRDLEAICGRDGVVHDPVELTVYEQDGYLMERARPGCVVLPRSTEQVSRVVKRLYRDKIPFIPRGAGTGLSGGTLALEGEVIIGLNRMNRIVEIDYDNQRATVEAGVINLHLNHALAARGYYYAPDPSSQATCTIGGNLAENSGGPHCLKYGVTTNHVTGAKVVMPDGEVVQFGGKAAEYPGYDLLGLLVGSEGTMGLATEITVRIMKKPQAMKTVLALFDSLDDASNSVSGIIGRGLFPAALEIMDRLAIKAVEQGSYRVGYPKDLEAVLIIEVDGLGAGLEEQAEKIVEVCRQNRVKEVRVAQTAAERALWWNNRKTAFGAAGKLAPDYYVQDGVIPRTRLAEVLGKIRAIAEREKLIIANVFHAGDGNLHPLICYDRHEPGIVERVVKAGSEILKVCVDAGGTITGEHGVGVEKQCDISLMFSPRDLEWQKRVRACFDPDALANPGKVFPTPARCVEMRPMTPEALAQPRGAKREID